jgi:(p)ppGpp synthase/HD superfamily hydrolase
MNLSQRYREALAFAYDLHRGQERKGSGVPYLSHLLAVSALALEHGANEDQAIAALLHDAAEDQGGAAILAEIGTRFGARVAAIVRACTDSLEAEKPPWKERKVRYLAHLAEAPEEAQRVSACDKLHNLRCIVADYRKDGEAVWGRFSGGKDGVLWYYRELANAFPADNPVMPEFRRELRELEALMADGGSAAGGVR